MPLPEDLIILILLDIDHVRRIGALRGVCVMFQRILDSPEVLRHLPLRELRQCLSRPRVGRLGFEERLHLAGNREGVCYTGMEMLMTWRDHAAGLVLVNQATVAGDFGAAYFLAMLQYHSNPADHEELALLHGISGSPSLHDGRWENRRLSVQRYWVRRDLHTIV
jgi:hypothetical protein